MPNDWTCSNCGSTRYSGDVYCKCGNSRPGSLEPVFVESLTNWRELIGNAVLMEQCRIWNAGRTGSLSATDEGIVFDSGSKQTLFSWLDVRKVDASGSSISIYPRSGGGPTNIWAKKNSVVDVLTLQEIANAYRSEQVNHESLTVQNVRALNCHVLDGAGWAPPIGEIVSIEISDAELILSVTSSKKFSVSFSDLSNISIMGYSSTTSAGITGGGFGVKGAAEGILAATIINSLTSRTKEWVIVNVSGKTGSVRLLIADSQEMPVKKLFRKVQDGLVQSANQHVIEPKDSIASSLERVISLFEKGLLTEDEFKAAKAKILE